MKGRMKKIIETFLLFIQSPNYLSTKSEYNKHNNAKHHS